MKELFEFLGVASLQQKTKEELIKLVTDLQEKNKQLFENNSDLITKWGESRKKVTDARKEHEKDIERYQNKLEEYIRINVEAGIKNENLKRIVDLKLGNTFNLNATWIDKIVFVLKAAGRPLRSSEIIEILEKNDITFRTLANQQKGLSAHLTKALKYGRILGEKLKGQNGYLYRLP
jgi:arsenate reductase-like glutaredoxin family protein